MNTGFENLNQAFISAFKNYARRTSYKTGKDGHYTDVRYEDLEKLTLRLVSYLRSAGLSPGDRVLIAARNSPEWMAACIASFLSGAIVVPASMYAKPDILAFISRDSSASVVFAEDAAIAQSVSEACCVQPRVVVMNGGNGGKTDSLPDILKSCEPHEDPRSLYGKAGELPSEKRAVIFYTALDSGRPRGAVFSHGGLLSTLLHVSEWFALDEYDLGFTSLSWSYFPSFVTGLHYLLSGVGNALSGGTASVFDDLQQTSPTVTMTSPFAIENIYRKIMSDLNEMPESRRKTFEWALALGRRYHASESTASKELRERYTRADMTFFGRTRAMLGGRLNRIYSAGAPLSNELVGYVEAIGLMPLNVYAVAESGGFPAVSSPFARRHGSCGQVAPGFQIRISDEGEVLVRGKTVVSDYWNNPPESDRVTDADGWLHTGDIGRFDPDGYLMLTGHKQSVFMLSYGRKISPSKIEGYLAESPYISRAIVLGEGKSYVSALIVPDLGGVAAHYAENGGGGAPPAGIDILSPEVKSLVDETVSEVNSRLNLWERIEAYTLIESAGETVQDQSGNGVPGRRTAPAEKYDAYVAAMYPDTVNIGKTDITQVQIEPDQLRDLLEKQDILQAWMEDAGIGFLLDLARSKSIDALAMINICETAASVAQIQSEEKPVSTALIVGDSTYISRILPDSEIQFQRYDHIRRMQQVVITLAKIVDGVVLGYGIDRHGFLRKVHKLEISVEESSNFLLGPQFRRHAAISRECDAIVFYVPTGGKQVRVFSDGQMVARYANGNWMAENLPRIDLTVDRIAMARNFDVNLLRRIFKCAFLMSERNLGALFIIGDAARILKKSDPPEISPFATIADSQLSRLTDGEIINFAKQDGATIIDSAEGKLRGCMVLLRPSAETRSEIGIGKGARHSSASKMSAEADCLAIAVSQDGPITIYDRGERVLSI